MTKMIVCMNYTQDGSRTIAKIEFGHSNYDILMNQANQLATLNYLYDEVYISDFDPNSQDFINAIVIHGCRILN